MKNITSAAFMAKVALASLLVCMAIVLAGCNNAIMTEVPSDERETGEIQGNPTTSTEIEGEASFLSQVTLRGNEIYNFCELTYNDQGLVAKVESERGVVPYLQSYEYDDKGVITTMTESYDDVLINYHYNSPTYTVENGVGTYIQSWTTEGSPSGTIGGRWVYTTAESNSVCKKLETTVYYSTGKSSTSVYEYGDDGQIASYSITDADGKSYEETYSYERDGSDESVQVDVDDREILWAAKVNPEGETTSLVNRRTGVTLLLVYGEKVAQPTDFSRLQNQINLSQFYSMAVGAALTNWDVGSAW